MNFGFNSAKYDFWPLYESINHYYPIGLSPTSPDAEDPSWQIYPKFKGQQEFGKLVDENFGNEEIFAKKWTSIRLQIGENLNLPTVGTTLGSAPSFSFYLEVSSQKVGNHSIFQRLHVAISLLGQFFSIWGQDGTMLQLNGKFYPATNVITVSPFEEYVILFDKVYQEILERFPHYKFVPYGLHNKTIPGLELRRNSWPRGRNGLIYHALFNYLLTGDEATRGDMYFSDYHWSI